MQAVIARVARLPLVTAAILLTACTGAGAGAAGPTSIAPTPIPSQSPQASPTTVTYCSPGGVNETMDIYQPTGSPASPRPTVMYVHGGGWSKGSSALGPPTGIVAQVTSGLVSDGFVVASINYRLAPEYHWPAQIEDTSCAVGYLRAHAGTYTIDPHRIGAFGGSAGGHLVSQLGTSQPDALQAVVDLWGPADLTAQPWPPAATQAITTLFGVLPSLGSPLLAQASPVTFVAPNDPPFLIVHGVQDATVPVSQSEEFYARLRAAGVPATLILVQNAGHGLRPTGTGPESPSQDEVVQSILAFFRSTLPAGA